MKSFANILPPLIFSLLVFQGCTKSENITPEKTAAQAQGTGDSGGGNTYAGKPLDSYIIQPANLESYKKNLTDLMDKVSYVDPVLFNIFTHVLVDKPWYLLPGPLDRLPSERIGSLVSTDQGALQSLDAVWIDSDIFSSMSLEGQADLILHELLMGMRLLRFESPKKQCLIVKAANFCDNKSDLRLGSATELTSRDYEDIRATVFLLKNRVSTSMYETLEDLMATKGFSFSERPFHIWANSTSIALPELITWITHTLGFGKWPTNGFEVGFSDKESPHLSSAEQISTSSCDLSFGFKSNVLKFELIFEGKAIQAQASYAMAQKITYGFGNGHAQKVIRLREDLSSVLSQKAGDKTYAIDLKFFPTDLQEIDFTELTCVSAESDTCVEWIQSKDSPTYACASEKIIVP